MHAGKKILFWARRGSEQSIKISVYCLFLFFRGFLCCYSVNQEIRQLASVCDPKQRLQLVFQRQELLGHADRSLLDKKRIGSAPNVRHLFRRGIVFVDYCGKSFFVNRVLEASTLSIILVRFL